MTERCDLRLPTYCVARAPGELGGMMHRWIARATGWPLAAKPPAVAAASSSTPILRRKASETGSGVSAATLASRAAAALHDLIEGFEFRSRLAVFEEHCRLQGGNLFRHSGSDELVHAGSILFA